MHTLKDPINFADFFLMPENGDIFAELISVVSGQPKVVVKERTHGIYRSPQEQCPAINSVIEFPSGETIKSNVYLSIKKDDIAVIIPMEGKKAPCKSTLCVSEAASIEIDVSKNPFSFVDKIVFWSKLINAETENELKPLCSCSYDAVRVSAERLMQL